MANDWIKNELKNIEFGDKRLNNRVLHIFDRASKQPQASINQMFHTRAEVQACYRFFSNDLVDESKMIEPHLKMTVERVSQKPVVLCLSDTTSLNYTTRKTLKDSGYISSNNAQGFFLHASIAITPDRLHLGVVSQKFWAREKQKQARSSRERETMLLSEKESYRWLEAYRDSCELAEKCSDTQIIHVTDREGDIFEIFWEYQSGKEKGRVADYIVRSSHDRTVYPKGNPANTLIKELELSNVLGEISFDIIKREDNSSRRVHQTVQVTTVEIKSRHGAGRPNQITTINAIYLKEIDCPEGENPIIWCLLTSLSINSLEEIIKIVSYYLCRWEIEIFFKTYKSGCKAEEKSLRSAERLYPLFSLLLIVAWRINFLLHMGRVSPNVSCIAFFDESEWKAGYVAATRNKNVPESPPTMREMMQYIAKLGGHLGRKKDPDPGIKAIWVGICKLTNYADAWDLFGPGATH